MLRFSRFASINVLVLLLYFSGGVTLASAESQVPADQVEQTIQDDVQLIKTRVKQMSDLYQGDNAVKTLQSSFKRHGVTGKAKGYAETWANQDISPTWESVQPFYTSRLTLLQKSLQAVKTKGDAKQSELDTLDQGMESWKTNDEELKTMFSEGVTIEAKRAAILDKKMAFFDRNSGKMSNDTLWQQVDQYQSEANDYSVSWEKLQQKIKRIAVSEPQNIVEATTKERPSTTSSSKSTSVSPESKAEWQQLRQALMMTSRDEALVSQKLQMEESELRRMLYEREKSHLNRTDQRILDLLQAQDMDGQHLKMLQAQKADLETKIKALGLNPKDMNMEDQSVQRLLKQRDTWATEVVRLKTLIVTTHQEDPNIEVDGLINNLDNAEQELYRYNTLLNEHVNWLSDR
jgi:hypothetical protein